MSIHLVLISSGRGLSHSYFFHNFCMSSLAPTGTGLKIPRGSKISDDCCKSSRFVKHVLSKSTMMNVLIQHKQEVDLEKFWNLESLGVAKKRFYDSYESSVEFQNGKYIAKLPKKDDFDELPSNYTVRNGGRTFRVFFCVIRLSVHSDGLFVLLDLTNIIEMESGEKKKS